MNEQENKNITMSGAGENTPAPGEASTSATLPTGYLGEGSMTDTDGALRPEYIGKYAQALAKKTETAKSDSISSGIFERGERGPKKRKCRMG